MDAQQKVGAVIVAAGKSQRMDGMDKAWTLLGGKPVVYWVIDTFHLCNSIDQIVVVINGASLGKCQQLVAEQDWPKVTDICTGGKRRQDSVLAGLSQLNNCDWVVIHDGARPFVTLELIEHGLGVALEAGAAVAAVPVLDTIKIVGNNGLVEKTPPRRKLWAAQTPQVFRFDLIAEAYLTADAEVTDDALLLERLGYRVKLYMGSYDNIKITTPDSLALAEVLWRKHGK